MRTVNILYNNLNQFKEAIIDNEFEFNKEYLIIIHTSIFEPNSALKLAKNIKKVLPLAQIIGTSANGLYYKNKQYDEGTLITIHRFSNTSVKIQTFESEYNTPESTAAALVYSTKHMSPKVTYVFCANHYPKIANFITAFNNFNTNTKLIGGIAGDIQQLDIKGYTFTDKKIVFDGMVTASLSGFRLSSYIKPIIGHEEISENFTITTTNHTFLKEIDHIDALEWFQKMLGINIFNSDDKWNKNITNDMLIQFPIILQNQNNSSRFIKYNCDKNKLESYYTDIDNNEKFKIGYLSPMKSVDECREICLDLSSTPCESLFSYSCVLRKSHLNNISKWEMGPFENFDLCTVYLFGEIGYLNGNNVFMHGSNTFLCLSESEIFRKINYSAFNNINVIQDASDEVINLTIAKIKNKSEYSELLNILISKENNIKNIVTVDSITGLKNMSQLAIINKNFDYNKLLMITIEHGDKLLNHMSRKEFCNIIKLNLSQIRIYIEKKYTNFHMDFLSVNEYTFALVASVELDKEEFLKMTRDVYAHFELGYSYENYICINRFFAVVSNPYLVSAVDTIWKLNEGTSQRYILYDGSFKPTHISQEELKSIDYINKLDLFNKINLVFNPIYNSKGLSAYTEIKLANKLNQIITNDIKKYLHIGLKYNIYNTFTQNFINKNLDKISTHNKKMMITICSVFLGNDIYMQEIIDFYKDNDLYKKLFLLISCENISDEFEILLTICTKLQKNNISYSISQFDLKNNDFFNIVKLKPNHIEIDKNCLLNISDDISEYYKGLFDLLDKIGIGIFLRDLELKELPLVKKYNAHFYTTKNI